MEAEIPITLIRSFQSIAREQAGVSWYDSSDPVIPGLPASLREVVAQADSEVPPYLKCHQCRTALPRGLQSATCAHCGVEQHREIPLSLSFVNTAAYRNLLKSLDLDGSEPVIFDTDPQKSSKGKDTVESSMLLSSFLDIELRWPPERKAKKTVGSRDLTAERNSALNLSAVDLDNFFIEKKPVSPGINDVSENLWSSDAVSFTDTNEKGLYLSPPTHVSSDSDDFAAFNEYKPSSTAEGSTNRNDAGSTESFAEWKADFQSAGPGGSLFHDFSVLDKTALHNDKEHRKEAEIISKINSSSAEDNWIPDGMWHASSEVPPNKTKKDTLDGIETESSSFSKMWPVSSGDLSASASKNLKNEDSFDVWQDFATSNISSEARPGSVTQPVSKNIITTLNKNEDDDDDNVWQEFSGSKIAFESLPNSTTQNLTVDTVGSGTKVNEVDDSFDVWQDFSSSKGASKALSKGEGNSLSENDTSNKSADMDFDDMDFGNFVQSGDSSGIATFHDSLPDKEIPLEASKSDRNNPMETKENQHDVLARDNENELSNCSSAPTHLQDPSSSSVESLLARMHDLSFMLKDDLSIPERAERTTFSS